MSEFTAADHRFMARALVLARRGLYCSQPNPRVGCVLVRDGKIIAEGWHRIAGEPHAEANALAAAGAQAQGSTVYVSLEPCSHYGKTPPCAAALVEAGVSTVIAAMRDPNPKVAGSGFACLRQAGIEVRTGLMQRQAAALNEGFISRVSRGRPFLRLKMAASLDGASAMLNGESQWITGADARRDVQRLRAMSGAIMTGVATVLADDPSLSVRDGSLDTAGRQPLRAVLDSRLGMPANARLLGQEGETLVFCVDDSNRRPLEDAGASVIALAADEGRVDPAAVLGTLADLDINEVLVESGPTLAGSLLAGGFVDELVIYQAPNIMGSETRGIALTAAWSRLEQRMSLTITDLRKVGTDLRITARPER